mgnify:CR=1 FL=1
MFGFNLPKVPEIDAQDVMSAIEKKDDFVLLDVRTEGEFSKNRIEGSINIPVDQIPQTVEKELPDKEKTTYVYCLSGSRSTSAVDIMVQMGYKNVFSITSGLLAWRAKNLPLLS